jgi:ribonucleoside-diphosphate reductase beta chain
VTDADRRPATARAGKPLRDSVPMRLYQEAKAVAAWDPRRLDLSQDARDWGRLSVTERDVLLRLTALFHVAEESMTRDLLPLLMTVVREDRPEEQLFLTTFLSDEAEHTEFFRRILNEVCRHSGDLLRYQTPSFEKLFSEKLPHAMRALLADASPPAQAEALVTYTLVGEGVLGEAGYHVFTTALEGAGVMPGFREGLRLARADEDRHMAYGLFVLSRLVAENARVWDVIGRRMEALLPDALGVVNEFFEPYDAMPFGLSLQATIEYTIARFAGRWASLEQARESARRTTGLEETVRPVLAWVRQQAQPALVEVRREGTAPIHTFRLGAEQTSALLITEEVLGHHAAGEIIAALSAYGVPRRLRDRAGLPLTCLRAGGKIVVQAPPNPMGGPPGP